MKLAVCSNKPHPAAVKVIAQLFDGEFEYGSWSERSNPQETGT